ncbi:MAG: flagellar biosynthetic protein FliR [bacterium]|nr:flagellar biosynthetic protein FliR [bacterium]
MEQFVQALNQAPYFMIVFARIGGFMAFVPFFNNQGYVAIVKVGFVFFLSLLLFPTVSSGTWEIPNTNAGVILILAAEVLVGVLMGLVFMIFLFALQLAGHMVGFQMAFSMANVMDATFGANANVLSVIMTLLGTMIVISMKGDHYLIYTLNRSFHILPPGTFASTKPLLRQLSEMFMHSFDIGFRLASPAIVVLLAIDVTLGLIGKTSQKMQIFFVGLPLKVATGLFGFTLIIGFISTVWAKDVVKLPFVILKLLKLMRI